MKTMQGVLGISITIMVMGAGPAQGLHCTGDVTTIALADGAAIYIDERTLADGNSDYRIYLEDNGQPGLQRGSDQLCPDTAGVCTLYPLYEPCQHKHHDKLLL